MFKPKNNHERGQSLIELALTLPILILILSGLLDLGRLYFTAIALEESVAEAALYLAIKPECPINNYGGHEYCNDPNNALYRGETVGGRQEINTDLTEWNLENVDSTQPSYFKDPFPDCKVTGCIVKAQVRYRYDFLTPGIEAIARGVTGGDFYLQFQATQIIVFE